MVEPDSKDDSLKSSSLIIPPDASGVSGPADEMQEQPSTSTGNDESELESNFAPTGMTSPVSSRPWDRDDDSLFSDDEEIVRVPALRADEEGYSVESDNDSFEIIEDSDAD